MKKIALFFGAVAVFFLSVGQITPKSAFAVDPPSAKSRKEAEDYKKKSEKKKAAEQRKSGCEYGKDEVTGKCYKPKEGQFYRDPKTGEVKVKKVEKWNFPWNPK